MGPGPWRWTQINQGELGGSFGVHFWVLDPFRGLLRAQKPKMRPIFGNIWTFPDSCSMVMLILRIGDWYRTLEDANADDDVDF